MEEEIKKMAVVGAVSSNRGGWLRLRRGGEEEEGNFFGMLGGVFFSFLRCIY